MSETNIKRYSAAELRAKRERGESKTDFQRLRDMSEVELERSIASDPDFRDTPHDWFKDALAVMPRPKRALSVRLDDEVVDWFKAQGPGYQTRMNAALLAYVRAAKKAIA